MSHHKTYLRDQEEKEGEKKIETGHEASLLGGCLFMLRLGISEPFSPPLVLWITPALDSMPLTANERKVRKNSDVPLKAPSVALGSLPVPLLLYPNESDHGENSHCLLLSGEVFSVPVRVCVKY